MKRILVIAGSDSSAGAGLQADLKTAQSFGVYAQTAVTAVTVQNTRGVRAIAPMTPVVNKNVHQKLIPIPKFTKG